MYKTSKFQLQTVMDRAKMLNLEIKTFVIDTDAVYHAKWSTRGVDVKQEVKPEEMDYMKLNDFNRPHLTLYLTVSVKWQQYLVIVIWGTEASLESLKNKYILQKEKSDELLEHEAGVGSGEEAERQPETKDQ